ncbi:MAG: DUF2029 domain-containing protein [Actinomycetota bacterium]|nr:DUF2029 domain-containing protein [Actinomycetota bacterium]
MPPTVLRRETVRPAVGLAVVGVAGVVLSAAVAGGAPVLADRWTILARLAVWAATWGVAVACALRLPRRASVAAVFGLATALRLAALAGPPTLSDDLYRYSWDGRVQAAGVNPYRHPPDSPVLARLREPWLWPDDAGCAALDRPPGCTRINRPSERTVYPPAAQAWFAAVYRLAGIDARHKAWQVAGLAVDLGLVALLPLVLRAWGRDERWTALYALSPFPVVEVVNNGHVDGLAALAVVGALLLAARDRPGRAGALIGIAAMVKLYPAVVLPGLAARRRGWLVPAVAGAAAVVALGYLPHVADVGTRVLGYLPGYLREEKYGEGGRYLLAGLLGLPATATAVVAGAGLAGVLGWVVLRGRDVPRAQAALLGALLLAATPVQPWYAVVLLTVATVAAAPVWAAVAAAGYPYFFAVILDHPHTVAIGRLSYGLALAAVAVAAWARRDGTVDPP